VTPDVFLFLTDLLVSAGDMVEALTTVLPVGLAPLALGAGRRGAALLALVAVVGLLVPSISRVPVDRLRVIGGALLPVFWLHWLRKRSCGDCHMPAAANGTAPWTLNLDDPQLPEEVVQRQVTDGGGGIPAFGPADQGQIAAVTK
jgi:mono/diheme cytochrome c family protein